MWGIGLQRARSEDARTHCPTFPSLAPVFALDRFYLRGLRCRSTFVPRGSAWARMSDHLPLVAELELLPLVAELEPA
jgi:endonuclease/exonuclease/phosphatase family metal-dependent hydrolase